MRIGLGSYACAWRIGVKGWPSPPKPFGAEELIREAASLGLNLVQIADNLPLDNCSHGDLRRLRDLARGLAIDVELGTRGIGQDHLRLYLEIAAALNSRLLRVVVDTDESKPSPDEVVDRMQTMLPEFAKAGIVLAIENHDRFPSRALAEIVRRIDSPFVGICLDTANSLGANEGIAEVLDHLAELTVNLHVKDIRIARKPHMMGFEISGAPAGEGALNVPEIFRRIECNGRSANAILELWPPFEEEIERTIEIEREWTRQSIRRLRELT